MWKVVLALAVLTSACSRSADGTNSPTAADARPRAPVYIPDPPQDALATAGGTGVMETTVSYCITPTGETTDVKTVRTSGNGKVDNVCEWTVRRWRFEPLAPEQSQHDDCSTKKFAMSFDERGRP